jgi:excisionase family DNA binding protein
MVYFYQLLTELKYVIQHRENVVELSEKRLRERGVSRSLEEIEGEVRAMISHSLGTLPVGLVGGEPAREFTEEEAGVLRRGGLTLEPYAGERDAPSRIAASYAAMLSLALTESEVREMLGVGASRVRQRVADGSLYAVNVGRERRFPAFQFDERTLVPSIGEVLKAMPDDLHPLEVESWLTNPDPDLAMDGKDGETSETLSPREWLISGGSVDTLLPTARDL